MQALFSWAFCETKSAAFVCTYFAGIAKHVALNGKLKGVTEKNDFPTALSNFNDDEGWLNQRLYDIILGLECRSSLAGSYILM